MLSSKMNAFAKAGVNHPKIEEENKCKNEEDINTVQADLRFKKTQETLSPDQLCNAQQRKRDQQKNS